MDEQIVESTVEIYFAIVLQHQKCCIFCASSSENGYKDKRMEEENENNFFRFTRTQSAANMFIELYKLNTTRI